MKQDPHFVLPIELIICQKPILIEVHSCIPKRVIGKQHLYSCKENTFGFDTVVRTYLSRYLHSFTLLFDKQQTATKNGLTDSAVPFYLAYRYFKQL